MIYIYTQQEFLTCDLGHKYTGNILCDIFACNTVLSENFKKQETVQIH
jgi:adenine-specific DNA methylase